MAINNRWAIRACRSANFCFILQFALVDNMGAEHPLVLGNIKQRSCSDCYLSSFSFGSSDS
jgi:hypothetical protein